MAPLTVRITEGRFTTIFYLLKTCLFAHSSELNKCTTPILIVSPFKFCGNSFTFEVYRNYHVCVKVIKKDFHL